MGRKTIYQNGRMKKISFYMPLSLIAAIKEVCDEQKIGIGAFMRKAAEKSLSEYGKEAK
jgi:hypothetical protein